MIPFSKWTTVCVVSLVVAARSGVAMADSKNSQRSRPTTRQSTTQSYQSQPQMNSDLSKFKQTVVQQVAPKSNPKSLTQIPGGLTPVPGPSPGGINLITGILQTVPLVPLPGNPAGSPNPMPTPASCDPCWHWPTWCCCSPWFWYDFGWSPCMTLYSTVEVVEIAAPVIDLEFLAVRLVDIGDLEKGLGPQYRVTFRNNSPVAITRSFLVSLMVGDGQKAAELLPQVSERLESMKPGEVRVLDLRLPVAANQFVLKDGALSMLHPMLFVAIDSNQELPESNELNNYATFNRADIPVVQP